MPSQIQYINQIDAEISAVQQRVPRLLQLAHVVRVVAALVAVTLLYEFAEGTLVNSKYVF